MPATLCSDLRRFEEAVEEEGEPRADPNAVMEMVSGGDESEGASMENIIGVDDNSTNVNMDEVAGYIDHIKAKNYTIETLTGCYYACFH